MENNKTIFSNRSESRVFVNLPKKFHGMYYVYSELEYSSARIDKDGDVYIFTKRNNGVVSLHGHLTSLGFVQDKSVEPFRMFDQATGEDTVVYHKRCKAGEEMFWELGGYSIQTINTIIPLPGICRVLLHQLRQ